MATEYESDPTMIKYFTDFEMMLALSETFSGKQESIIDEKIYSVSFDLMYFEDKNTLKSKAVNMEACKNDSFVNHYNLFKDYKFDNKLCVSKNQTFPLEEMRMNGLYGMQKAHYFYVTFQRCINSTENGNKCAPMDVIEKYLNFSYITIYSVDNYVDTKNYASPLYKTLSALYFGASLYSNSIASLLFQNIDFISDVGLIMKDQQIISGYKRDEFRLEKDQGGNTSPFATLVIELYPNKQIYNRKYYKIQDIAAQIGGIFNGLSIMANLVLFLYNNNTFNYFVVEQLFFHDENQERKSTEKINEKRINNTTNNETLFKINNFTTTEQFRKQDKKMFKLKPFFQVKNKNKKMNLLKSAFIIPRVNCCMKKNQAITDYDLFVKSKLNVINILKSHLDVKKIKYILFSEEQINVIDNMKYNMHIDEGFLNYVFDQKISGNSFVESMNKIMTEKNDTNQKLLKLIGTGNLN
jgi:hypothetical protein